MEEMEQIGLLALQEMVKETLEDCAFSFEQTGNARQRFYELELNSVAEKLSGSQKTPSDEANTILSPQGTMVFL